MLGGIDDPHLIVSTKYTMGDFYSHLPLNPTLEIGSHRRIVEFQARREFEGFGALPNDLVADEAQALQQFLAANPHVEGVWNWTQDGGPLRAGPMTLYLRDRVLADVRPQHLRHGAARVGPGLPTPSQVTGGLGAADPVRRPGDGRRDHRGARAVPRGDHPRPVHRAVRRADRQGARPRAAADDVDLRVGHRHRRLRGAGQHLRGQPGRPRRRDRRRRRGGGRCPPGCASRSPRRPRTPGTRPSCYRSFVDALDYETDLLGTLAAYRTTILRHAQWLDTGSATAHDRVADRRAGVPRRPAPRTSTGTRGDLDLPAYSFTAADLGSDRADRDPAMAWLARVLLLAVVAVLVLGLHVPARVSRVRPRLRALVVAATRPWRLGEVARPDDARRPGRSCGRSRPSSWWPAGCVYTWFAAPAHLVATLGAWLLLAVVLRCVVARAGPVPPVGRARRRGAAAHGRSCWSRSWSAGPGATGSASGPTPASRTAYITVAFAAFCWLFVVVAARAAARLRAGHRRGPSARPLAAGGTALAVVGRRGRRPSGWRRALTVWNDQMALLPWGLSRILGITVYLGIPPSSAAVARGRSGSSSRRSASSWSLLGRRGTVRAGASACRVGEERHGGRRGSRVHNVEVFLLVAGAVAVTAVCRRRGWPAPLVLVAAAIVVSVVPGVPRFEIDPEILLDFVLPPLLYSAALSSSYRDFRTSLNSITRLGVGLVLVSARRRRAGVLVDGARRPVPRRPRARRRRRAARRGRRRGRRQAPRACRAAS